MINLNRFDLVTLRLFVAVVDAGSLTAGAERFGISLAATSKRIAEMEGHCGVTLLARGQRGVLATAEGLTVHRLAIEVIAGLEHLAQAVDDFRDGAGGHLRLSANPSALGGFLPELLARYAQRYPNVRVELEDLLSEDSVRAVQKGAVELAVIGDNVPCEGLETLPCHFDELVLLLPRAHALAQQASARVEEALALDQIALPRSASLTRQLVASAESAGLALRVRMQVRSFDSMCRMVACGLGVAVMPRSAAQLYAQALELSTVSLTGAPMERRLLLAMRRRTGLSSAAVAFLEMASVRVPNREEHG
ncbi:transcriptional regulator [Burkholderiales bacterium JOSHI_001]|nr:transcriptional regulator [Burkholderiales bacterium JOSHI_001]